ncbi:Tn3 transposase DDE domain-containing protein [Nonomuraea jiangxiensis]|uniref:Tn3 transposase DDE domain-containing protein n=2 Tax=Nonomuraea jiangxiensis TaxID=633440 RepID=A0A1G9PL78_9ACTN|nr:Tn3 transposase DDE domain-containing protein [Nonomuraea jiangxiensis]
MVEGATRHGTTMKVEGDYVDSHGESEPGLRATGLLNVDLLPRIKQINQVKLYQADYGDLARYTGRCWRSARTTFVARYLYDRDLQREIEEGLNVVEAWNHANSVICYGRGGEISTNRRDEVEMTALCLRILQASLVMVNVRCSRLSWRHMTSNLLIMLRVTDLPM